jgi:hypothetical protein
MPHTPATIDNNHNNTIAAWIVIFGNQRTCRDQRDLVAFFHIVQVAPTF